MVQEKCASASKIELSGRSKGLGFAMDISESGLEDLRIVQMQRDSGKSGTFLGLLEFSL